MLFLLRRRHHLAGIIAILSVLVRQTNLIWLCFVGLYLLWTKYSFKISKENYKRLLADWTMPIFGAIAFAIFVFINGNVAMAVSEVHPAALHLGIYILFVV